MTPIHPEVRGILPAVFTAGLVLMGVEMTAAHLLAPWFGSSDLVWTLLLALVLVALTAGYELGGRLAHLRPETVTLRRVLQVSGALVVGLPWIAPWILSPLASAGSLPLPAGVGLALALLIAPPVLVLSMTSPVAIRLLAPGAEDSGTVSGRVFGAGTLGSLVGTFLPGLFLLPALGARATLGLLGGITVLVSLRIAGSPAPDSPPLDAASRAA